MSKDKETKSIIKTLKGVTALTILASGTVYTFTTLAKDNKTIITVAGIALTAFCVSAVFESMN